MTCACPTHGYCPAFGKTQSARHWQICRGEVLTPEACDTYRANWMAMAYTNGHDPLACAYRSEMIDQRTQKVESKGCGTCNKRGETIPVYGCAMHGKCTLKPWNFGQVEAVCSSCGDRKVLQPQLLDRKRIAPAQLVPAEFQFNNSLVRFRGKLYMAYRVNWNDSRLVIAALDENLNVTCNSWLSFSLGMAQEDPRLFVFRGELHISFSAVYSKPGKFWTDVCYARLSQREDGHWLVEDQFAPQYKGRAAWEKNWGFFAREDELYCVYSIKPHKVLRIDGDNAELVAETNCGFPKKPGLLHGGAPPIYHEGEYYSFFHRRLGASQDKWYTLDLYTFEAQPPFRPSRYVELPLLVPTIADRPGATVPYALFPGGAFLENGRWRVSFGYYDKWSEVAEFDAAEIERCLTIIGGPMDGVSYRRNTDDLQAWKQISLGNLYGLPDKFSSGDVIVDLGAHVGAFSRACLERGAGYVVATEPLPESFELLRKNLAYYPQSTELQWLAVGTKDKVELHQPDRESTINVNTRGRGQSVGVADARPLAHFLPAGKVRLLKLSIEGAEYDALDQAGSLVNVEEIVGVAQRIDWKGKPTTPDTIVELLSSRGFTVAASPLSADRWLFSARRTAPRAFIEAGNNPLHHIRVWQSVVDRNEYRVPDDLSGLTVVDVGASIGDFSWLCLQRGAARVIAFEPTDKLRTCWELNCGDFADRAECREHFVSGLPVGEPFTYPSGGNSEFSPGHWNAERVKVLTVAFNAAVAGKIDLLKLDCEGAEHSILRHSDLSTVRVITGEAHRIITGSGELTMHDLDASLRQQGYDVLSRQTGRNHWLFWARRPGDNFWPQWQ